MALPGTFNITGDTDQTMAQAAGGVAGATLAGRQGGGSGLVQQSQALAHQDAWGGFQASMEQWDKRAMQARQKLDEERGLLHERMMSQAQSAPAEVMQQYKDRLIALNQQEAEHNEQLQDLNNYRALRMTYLNGGQGAPGVLQRFAEMQKQVEQGLEHRRDSLLKATGAAASLLRGGGTPSGGGLSVGDVGGMAKTAADTLYPGTGAAVDAATNVSPGSVMAGVARGAGAAMSAAGDAVAGVPVLGIGGMLAKQAGTALSGAGQTAGAAMSAGQQAESAGAAGAGPQEGDPNRQTAMAMADQIAPVLGMQKGSTPHAMLSEFLRAAMSEDDKALGVAYRGLRGTGVSPTEIANMMHFMGQQLLGAERGKGMAAAETVMGSQNPGAAQKAVEGAGAGQLDARAMRLLTAGTRLSKLAGQGEEWKDVMPGRPNDFGPAVEAAKFGSVAKSSFYRTITKMLDGKLQEGDESGVQEIIRALPASVREDMGDMLEAQLKGALGEEQARWGEMSKPFERVKGLDENVLKDQVRGARNQRLGLEGDMSMEVQRRMKGIREEGLGQEQELVSGWLGQQDALQRAAEDEVRTMRRKRR